MLFIFGVVLSFLALSDSALLLWSSRQLQIPALKVLEEEGFEKILDDLNQPNVAAFNADFDQIGAVIPRKLENLRSAYVPMTNFYLENSQDLSDDLNSNTRLIEETLQQFKKNNNYENVIVAIFFNSNRVKREDTERNVTVTTPITTTTTPITTTTSTESTTTTTEPSNQEHKGPVVYNGNGSVIIYSSQAPRLSINSITLSLGPSISTAVDIREGYTRLNAPVAVGNGKVILRFKFPAANGYWSLTSVEVVDQRTKESKSYNLTITSNVGAAQSFSYHCHKETIFKNAAANIELVLYKVQAQPDAKKGRFSDAYNCVNFMTGPIWSGILVTASLIVGFFIALAALGDIKTMDKFDNYRTKQLNITVAE